MKDAVDELGKFGVDIHQPREFAQDEKRFWESANCQQTFEQQDLLIRGLWQFIFLRFTFVRLLFLARRGPGVCFAGPSDR